MAKKILKASLGIGGMVAGGFPGALAGIGGGILASKLMKKKSKGVGEPLPVGAINPDGSAIPVDSKRRRLRGPGSTILSDAGSSGSTLGG